jgi:hypothetical protein
MTAKQAWSGVAAVAGGVILLTTAGAKLEGCAGRYVVTQDQFIEHDRAVLEELALIRKDIAVLEATQ